MPRPTYEEKNVIPLGELMKSRAKAMYPDNPVMQDAWERGATWMCDIVLDDTGKIVLKTALTEQN